MGLMGSLFGGALGFALGGPLGAILGAAIGHGVSGGVGIPHLDRQQQAQTAYFVSVFSMLAKMARADGRVSQSEIDMVTQFMRQDLRLDAEAEQAAVKIFRAARDSPASFEQFAQQFHQIFQTDRDMLYSMLDLLHRLAAADGQVTADERRLLAEAARIFGLQEDEARHVVGDLPTDLDKHYAVLGLDRSATKDEVRSRYRKLVADNHPDKIIAKGLPEEFVAFAHQRFREIQEAYEAIQKSQK
jgi:DnaJ like chaperone protein